MTYRTHALGDEEWVCLDDGITTPHEPPIPGFGLGISPLGTSPLGG